MMLLIYSMTGSPGSARPASHQREPYLETVLQWVVDGARALTASRYGVITTLDGTASGSRGLLR